MANIRDFVVSWIAKLKTIEGFDFVDVWNDQVKEEIEGETFLFPLPALFFEVKNPENIVQLGQGVTQSNMSVDVHIMMDKINNVPNGEENGDGAISQNLDIFDLKAAVARALFGFKPTGSGIFVRESREQDYKHTNVYHGVISFKGAFIDTSGTFFDAIVQATKYQTIDGTTVRPVINVIETTELTILADIEAELQNDIDTEI